MSRLRLTVMTPGRGSLLRLRPGFEKKQTVLYAGERPQSYTSVAKKYSNYLPKAIIIRYTLKEMQHSTGIPHDRNGMEKKVSVSNAAFPWNSSWNEWRTYVRTWFHVTRIRMDMETGWNGKGWNGKGWDGMERGGFAHLYTTVCKYVLYVRNAVKASQDACT